MAHCGCRRCAAVCANLRPSLRSIVMSTSVCLSVSLSVCSQTARPNFTIFVHVPVAMVRSSSDGVAICYVISVLRMTSCFHTMWPIGPESRTTLFRRVRQVDVRQLQYLVEFVRIRHQGESLLSRIVLMSLSSSTDISMSAIRQCGLRSRFTTTLASINVSATDAATVTISSSKSSSL